MPFILLTFLLTFRPPLWTFFWRWGRPTVTRLSERIFPLPDLSFLGLRHREIYFFFFPSIIAPFFPEQNRLSFRMNIISISLPPIVFSRRQLAGPSDGGFSKPGPRPSSSVLSLKVPATALERRPVFGSKGFSPRKDFFPFSPSPPLVLNPLHKRRRENRRASCDDSFEKNGAPTHLDKHSPPWEPLPPSKDMREPFGHPDSPGGDESTYIPPATAF